MTPISRAGSWSRSSWGANPPKGGERKILWWDTWGIPSAWGSRGKELAEMAGLLGTEVHPVCDHWVGRKDFCSAYHSVRGSTKDLYFFRTVIPIKTSKIMGLQGIHSCKAWKQQVGLSFCPWCGKEGENEGTIVNHLCIMHYHLGLVCERCLSYFTAMSDKMWCHAQGCPCTPSHKDNRDGEAEKFTWTC